MSFSTTGSPLKLMTWAISPPMVPAPTTAALKMYTCFSQERLLGCAGFALQDQTRPLAPADAEGGQAVA